MAGSLLAVSDLHVSHRGNREIVEGIRPETDDDWLLVAGDVADRVDDVAATLGLLAERFRTVVWTPGNHELWTLPRDRVQLRGEERYLHLVDMCRGLGVITPEDPYPVWEGRDGPLVVVPLFLLYDYSFRPEGTTRDDALARAYEKGVVCTDEALLHPDPYPGRDAWCHARVRHTAERLDALPDDARTVLLSHYPLHPAPTQALWFPDFALWCGTRQTEDWHLRYRAAAVVYGHLHIPRSVEIDGVPFQEVSLGYPREWRRWGIPSPLLRRVDAAPAGAPASGRS